MRAGKPRKGKLFLLVTNIFVVVLYLLVSLVPFLDPSTFWYIGMLGLGFPFLFILLILFIIIWVLMKSKWLLLPLISIFFGWQQLLVAFAFHFKNNSDSVYNYKTEGSLRVLSWNVSKWDEGNKAMRGGVSFRDLMFDYIELQNADVLCFQEFFESKDLKKFEANIPRLKSLGFKYSFFYPTSFLNNNNFQFGLSIFSKYPITRSDSLNNSAGIHSEGICYSDIQFNGKMIRIFNMHPESPGFNKNDFSDKGRIKVNNSVLSKIKYGYQLRGVQTIVAQRVISESPYPSIICIDLGDTPNSYAYFKLKGNFQDAFLKKGDGMGRTYRFISPSLRIDYIFLDRKLKVENFYIGSVNYSDHFPIIADIKP